MLVATEVGDYERSLGMLAELEGLAHKIGNEFWYYRQLNSAGWLYLNIGDLDAALDRNQRASVESLHRPDAELTANADLNLADTYLARGDVAAAQEVLERVFRLSKNPGTSDYMRWRYSQHLFASLAELWLARGDAAKAGEFAGQCLTLARKHGSKKYVATSLRLLGETAFARTAFDEAKQPLTRALEIGEQIGGPTQIWKAHAALGRLHAELRRPEQAMESYRAGLQVLEDLKARIQNPSLRLSFERSPYLACIRDLMAATPGH
jgi:tetratricopeptide (TPR) repeat protein